MTARRWTALVSLVTFAAGSVLLVVLVVVRFPRNLLFALALWVALVALGWAVRRRGASRGTGLAASGAALVAAAVLLVTGESILEGLVVVALLACSVAAARRSLTIRVVGAPAARPAQPVVVWNARSGGGKALTHHLADEARARGIEPIELRPGDDLTTLVRDAVARGADALAAAGGDGTQALVAAIAAEHGLPFACIPAGTRNHFALDLGVDRDDVVGALDAFVSGWEKRVDLAEVNGRVFVNNVSLGLYAEAVQRDSYRDAKLRTILDTAPDVVGVEAGESGDLVWSDPDGRRHARAQVILVSNGEYRLGRAVGSGTRPRLDTGRLGIAVLRVPGERAEGEPHPRRWLRWGAPAFEVASAHPVPAGVDGEALVLDPPLEFRSRPGALRVRLAPHHPGVSPSAGQPDSMLETVRLLAHYALGRESDAWPEVGRA